MLDGSELAASTTRVFSSVPLAKLWFNWSGGGKLAQCRQADATKVWQQQGYTVSDLRRARESFPLPCDDCLRHTLRAWRLNRTIDKPGDRATQIEDLVVVRIEYVVITFVFSSFDYEPTFPEEYVKNVLEH